MKLTLDNIYKPWKVIFVNNNNKGEEQSNETKTQQCKSTKQQCNKDKT